MGSVLSLFSGVEPIPPQYQVFINFRGEELREGFIGFLEDALKKEKVNVFVDHNELKGTKLNNLFTRIEESKIALAIFSQRYTESVWCLDELVKIKECMDQNNLRMIPVFFNVKAGDVKKLKGKFGHNFRNLENKFQETPVKTEKWKETLKSVSEILGLRSADFRNHKDFVDGIVEAVNKVLKDIAEKEEKIAEVKRNKMAARTEEVIKCVIRFLALGIILTVVLGPYLIGILCTLAFFLGNFTIKRAVDRQR